MNWGLTNSRGTWSRELLQGNAQPSPKSRQIKREGGREMEEQVSDFLEKTNTKFEAVFLGNFPYFEEDKESRDVYQITLSRNGKTYTFRFGQSIANSGEFYKRNPYGKTIYDHELIRRSRIKPTAYGVLACVQKHDIGAFSDFCSDFGYDQDSRKAEKLYFRVQEEFKNIYQLFSDVMEEVQEIE